MKQKQIVPSPFEITDIPKTISLTTGAAIIGASIAGPIGAAVAAAAGIVLTGIVRSQEQKGKAKDG